MTLLGLGFPETNETATLETEAMERSAERRGTQRKCEQGGGGRCGGSVAYPVPSCSACPLHTLPRHPLRLYFIT